MYCGAPRVAQDTVLYRFETSVCYSVEQYGRTIRRDAQGYTKDTAALRGIRAPERGAVWA